MREAYGDLWDFVVDNGGILVITTNGTVKKDGRAVMGRGIALEATKRFPYITKELGVLLTDQGNHVFDLGELRIGKYEVHIVSMPVKHNWWEKADPKLIQRSAFELDQKATEKGWPSVWMPRPGCGNGGLRWEDVKPRIEDILDDRFIAVTK